MIPILNVLWGIVAGKRYNYNDPVLTDLLHKLVALLRSPLTKPDATWFFPFLEIIFPHWEGSHVEYKTKKFLDIQKFLGETIQHHKESFDGNNIRDFIDAYIIEIQVKFFCPKKL